MTAVACIVAVVMSYLWGSVPFGFLIARLRGMDIRQHGSGNIGATNVFRTVGKTWGVLTFLCDAIKGVLAVTAIPALAAVAAPGTPPALRLVCAAAVIAGHNWTVFLGFRGGKGVATSAGALLGIAWAPVLCGLCVWVALFLTTRYVSVASILASLSLTVTAWVFRDDASSVATPVVITVLGVLAVVRHLSNIRRLLAGTENRFSFRGKGKEG